LWSCTTTDTRTLSRRLPSQTQIQEAAAVTTTTTIPVRAEQVSKRGVCKGVPIPQAQRANLQGHLGAVLAAALQARRARADAAVDALHGRVDEGLSGWGVLC
jgi:hypothetical protein